MKYTVRWLPSASQDLKSIREFLDEEAPDRAKEVAFAIYQAAEGLCFMPTKYQRDEGRPEFRRLVVLYKYKVFFRIVGKTVEISYIRHTARKPTPTQW